MSYWDRQKLVPEGRCRILLSAAKNRSKTKELDFNLDLEYLISLWDEQDGCCCITGVPFNLDYSAKHREPNFDAPSLDRIVPELGYIKGNVRLVAYQVNMAIGPYGLEHFLDLCKQVVIYNEVG